MRLDSPLRPEPFLDSTDDGQRCQNHSSVWSEVQDFRTVRQKLLNCGDRITTDFPRFLAQVMLTVADCSEGLSTEFDLHPEYPTMVKSAIEVANRHTTSCMNIPIEFLCRKLEGDNTLHRLTKAYTVAREFMEWSLRWYLDSKSPEPVLKKPGTKFLQIGGVECFSFLSKYELCKYQQACFMIDKVENQVIFLYGDALRCLCDLIGMRQLVILSCDYARYLDEPGLPPLTGVARLLYLGDNILRKHGNLVYDALKLHESLCIGQILLMTYNDPITTPEEFLKAMVAEFNQKVDVSVGDPYIEFLTSQTNADHIAQYYGLFRLWGHPLVDMISGLKNATVGNIS
ncbi:unnamed protein product [Nippostrongylus brasiliensis]|uniref:RdRp catalytic domain-containing protein n=1 Tax=Nippostrongylus brasiliensis TaxID=27835 RepID=A0A0N4XD24_NIPBR|nr:unnamed protein product [Nippostrongylus brasiliensis]